MVDKNHSRWNGQIPELPSSEFDFGGPLIADAVYSRLGPRESTLTEIVWLLRKRKWMIIATVLVTVTLATLLSVRMTPKYDATARIAFTREGNENLGFKDIQGSGDNGAEDYDYTVTMDTQTRILQSDRLALEVINNLHLDQNRAFAGDLTVAPSKVGNLGSPQVSREREAALLGGFHGAMSVSTVRNTRILDIAFRSPDPALAAAIANNLVTTYVEDNYRTRYESTMQASDWLAKQISDLQLRVETSQ